MNVTQMHLAVQLGVDKINSLQADMLLSEELDIELNKSMVRFINLKYGKNNIYNKGFEESQKRVDDLRTLVTEYSATTAYKEQYSNKFWVDTFTLPSNYLYLVNQRSKVLIDNCDPIAFSIEAEDVQYYFVIPFSNFYGPYGLNGQDVFIRKLRMVADTSNPTLGDVVMLNLQPGLFGFGINQMDTMFSYPADVVALQNEIQNPANWNPGFEFYWETLGNVNYPDSFIVTVDINLHPWLNTDSSITNTVSGVNNITTAVGNFASSALGLADPQNSSANAVFNDGTTLQAKRVTDKPTLTDDMVFNKFIQHDDIAKLLEDPFNTTKHTSPLTTIRNKNIDIYTSDIFIIDALKITYLRKPQEISLSLGISCELPIHSHQEIVDMTVSSILEGISDPRYKSASAEAKQNE